MNTYRENNRKNPFTPMASPGDSRVLDENSSRPSPPALPEGWRRLATGLRGTRLYWVMPPGGEGIFWLGEMMLNGKTLRRRFAGELHARAWLTAAIEPHPAVPALDLEEIHGAFRTACVVAKSAAPF